MNAFYEHHKDSVKFRYGCFDRILLNACIPVVSGWSQSARILLGLSKNLSRESKGLTGSCQ